MLWSATTSKTSPYLVNCWLEIFSPLFWHFFFLPTLQHWFICIMKHMVYVVLVYTNTLGPLYKCGSCSIYPVSNSGVKTPKVFSPLIHLTYHFSQYILFKGKYVSTTYVHWSSCIAFNNVIWCHDRDIPPQPSHTCSCLLAVQTPPEHSLTKPEPIPGLPDPSIAFLNSSAAFLKGCCTDVCLVSIPEAVNTIPKHIWPFPTNPKHLESHRPTLSLYAPPEPEDSVCATTIGRSPNA